MVEVFCSRCELNRHSKTIDYTYICENKMSKSYRKRVYANDSCDTGVEKECYKEDVCETN